VCKLNVAASGQKDLTYRYWLAPASKWMQDAEENCFQWMQDAEENCFQWMQDIGSK
jgi:hypothetical protein